MDHLELEDGLAIRLRPHQKVVVQSHYVNTSEEALRVRDVINLGFLPEGVTPIPTSFWATTYFGVAVPPQSPSTLKYRCTADRELKLLSLVGHMHEQGSSVSIDIGPPDAPRRVYSVEAWEKSFRDTPPEQVWPKDTPFIVNAGDVMDVTCNWRSTAQETLRFPIEMCGSNAWFFPAESAVTCAASLLAGDAAGE